VHTNSNSSENDKKRQNVPGSGSRVDRDRNVFLKHGISIKQSKRKKADMKEITLKKKRKIRPFDATDYRGGKRYGLAKGAEKGGGWGCRAKLQKKIALCGEGTTQGIFWAGWEGTAW